MLSAQGSAQTVQSLEAQTLLQKINNSQSMPQGLKEKAMQMIWRVDKLIQASKYGEYESIENYVNWITRIPFGNLWQDSLDFEKVKNHLNKNHHGLQSVKEKILEYLSIMKLKQMKNTSDENQTQKPPILLFIGIQGIGKTTMAKSFAQALGRQFTRISLGGMASVQELRGLSRTVPEAEPGQIIKALIHAGYMNPLILLDELDKVSKTGGTNQDVMAALLEILDPAQNSSFVDRYVDFPVDVSQCLFIATANNIGGITSALLDRMEVVRFTSYNDEDKEIIAKKYLLPKIRKQTGLTKKQLNFSDDVWPLIIRPLGFDAGIRELERTLINLARKVAKLIVEGQGESFTISPENFRQFIPDDFGVYA
ncbi:AAA family ATPase [Candidatus Dojkabacteria bacterium]|nr:AAA family ATPase [Candidatus Dojkabacteria bacterium]